MALTRAEMEQVIKEGGSILHGGQIITRVEHLPNEAELAKGDPEKEQLAAADIQAKMADLQAQLDSLKAAQQEQQGTGNQDAETLLPDDFPFATQLRAAGFVTYEQVASASDKALDDIPDVGAAAIKQIRAALPA